MFIYYIPIKPIKLDVRLIYMFMIYHEYFYCVIILMEIETTKENEREEQTTNVEG